MYKNILASMPAQKLVDKHSLKILNMEPANIPSNNSRQQLMPGQQCGEDCDSLDGIVPSKSSADVRRSGRLGGIMTRHWLTVGILCFVNLINYMDRFTIAGILTDVQKEFGIHDDEGGLLQTAFILSYMVFAPLFGYMGDRYSRKAIMAFGVFLWSLTTLLGSFMTNFSWFLFFRALVGIGEASYSTIAPTIISDLFVNDVRSKMLTLFYFAIPVGSGLGYIVGSEVAHLAGSWAWGLRVTPIAGAIAVLLILFVLEDPERGEIEGSNLSPTSWSQDIKALSKNPTFMLTTAGFTCVAFVTGALAWWGPAFIHSGLILQEGHQHITLNEVSLLFGVATMTSGLLGVPLGSFLGQRLRKNSLRADPIICGLGLIISTPFIVGAIIMAQKSFTITFVLIFLGELALNLNWAIVADMLLYVVIPTRRSTAEAFQILISHALGDAGSPYLVGVISESLKHVLSESSTSVSSVNVGNLTTAVANSTPTVDPLVKFHSLQYALFTASFVEIFGGCFFLFAALYIVRDKLRAETAVNDNNAHPTHLFADDANGQGDALMAHSTTVVA